MKTYQYTFVLEILYAVGFAFIGAIINAVGKLPIICKLNTNIIFTILCSNMKIIINNWIVIVYYIK